MQKTVSDSQYWSIMKNFIKETGLVRQHVDSYNDFIDSGLQSIIDEVKEIPIEIEENPFTIKLGKI
jgi:DNA-directed RNA polymerase subunit B